MKKRFEITEEEFEAIKEMITSVLRLWSNNYIKAEKEDGSGISMSKETFFKALRDEFIIIKWQN